MLKRAPTDCTLPGGYDNRVSENVTYHRELDALATSLGLQTGTAKTITTALAVPDTVEVLFLLSVPNALKEALLRSASLLVYTPSNEHFGIVPLEAMLAAVPVLAANNGGPTETVVEHTTGWLRDPARPEEWTEVMDKVLHGLKNADRKHMAEMGVARVKAQFAVDQMAKNLSKIFQEMDEQPRKKAESAMIGVGLGLVGSAAVALFFARWLLVVWSGKQC